MGQSTTWFGMGTSPSFTLPPGGISASRVVADFAPARPCPPVKRTAEPLSPGERTRSAPGCSQVGRTRARSTHGGSRTESP